MNNRDTQFAGFAKLLLTEIDTVIGNGAMFMADHEMSEKEFAQHLGLLIAQRAYDLVEHTIEAMQPYIYDEKIAGQESVKDVPDLTEWPKEQKETK